MNIDWYAVADGLGATTPFLMPLVTLLGTAVLMEIKRERLRKVRLGRRPRGRHTA